MEVKLLDLVRQYEGIREEIDEAIEGVLSSQRFILGDRVAELEERIASFCGVRHAVGVASGSDAILISLMFRYIFAFREFDVVWILTGGGPFRSTELLSIYLYKRGFTYYEFGIASAVAWVMVLITALIGAYYFYILYKRMFRDDT